MTGLFLLNKASYACQQNTIRELENENNFLKGYVCKEEPSQPIKKRQVNANPFWIGTNGKEYRF